MRTYDPADRMLYVHLAQGPAPEASRNARDECQRLSANYANASLRDRLGDSPSFGTRPTLVVLPGGAATVTDPTPSAPALRLAR